MKQAAVILTGILVLLAGKSTTATSGEPFHLENMTCSITSANMNGCTGVPTLHSGILTLSKEGTFKLKARYEGCFMVENVTKSGDLQHPFRKANESRIADHKDHGDEECAIRFSRDAGVCTSEL